MPLERMIDLGPHDILPTSRLLIVPRVKLYLMAFPTTLKDDLFI